MNLKRKNIVLGLGFLFFLWLAYSFSFKKSVDLKKEIIQLKKEQQLYHNVDAQINRLSVENSYYDSILSIKKLSLSHSFQSNLLARISTFAEANYVKIKDFNLPHQVQLEKSKINTFSFTAMGSFQKLMELVYKLEQEYRLGKIISVDFSKKKDRRRRKSYLEATIYLQQVETSSN